MLTKGCLRLSLLECPANLPHFHGAETVRLRDVTTCSEEKSNPNHWSSYRCLLPLQESPATFHVAEKLLRREARTLQGRGPGYHCSVAELGCSAGDFCCIALPLLRSMIVHRPRHGDHCPCCTCLHIPSLHRAQRPRALGTEGILHLEGSR